MGLKVAGGGDSISFRPVFFPMLYPHSILITSPLSPYSTENWFCVGHQTQMKSTQKKRNVHCQSENFVLGTQPKLNSIDSCRFGIFALGDAKVLSFALGDAKVPNANGFASQWNIGFPGSNI